ncbi:MAG: hypothetical protein U0797_09845 [Gemmataceae bacterium]
MARPGAPPAPPKLAREVEPVVCDVLDPASLKGLPEARTAVHCVGYDRQAGLPMRRLRRGVDQRAGGATRPAAAGPRLQHGRLRPGRRRRGGRGGRDPAGGRGGPGGPGGGAGAVGRLARGGRAALRRHIRPRPADPPGTCKPAGCWRSTRRSG